MVAAATLAIAGLAVNGASKSDGQEPSVDRRFDGGLITASGFQLRAPPGWARSGERPGVPGIESPESVVLVETGSRTRMIAARLAITSTTLIPMALLDRLQDPPGRPERVRLGSGLAAYYYNSLSLAEDPGARIDVYAAPTTDGVATVACTSDDAYRTARLVECGQVARSMRLTQGAPVSLTEDTAFWLRISSEISAVDVAREHTRERLSMATTSAAQAGAARHLGEAYNHAAAAVGSLASHSPALMRIVAQLRSNAATYRRLSGALEARDAAAVARDRRVALAGEARLRHLLATQS